MTHTSNRLTVDEFEDKQNADSVFLSTITSRHKLKKQNPNPNSTTTMRVPLSQESLSLFFFFKSSLTSLNQIASSFSTSFRPTFLFSLLFSLSLVTMPSFDLDDVFPKISRSGALRFSPLLVINGLSRKASFYWKLPQEPIKLSVLKLDGSCFQIEVTKASTVAELKQAVEDAFSHMPKKGPGKISWLHVWGHFCLCYNDQKLVTETEYIKNYGIKDGDQLHFVRHQSINYNLRKLRQKRRRGALKQPRISDGCEERESNGEEDENQENGKKGILRKREKFKLSMLLGGWFSYSKLTSAGRRKYEGKTKTSSGSSSKSKSASGLLGNFRKMLRLYNKRSSSRRMAWRED